MMRTRSGILFPIAIPTEPPTNTVAVLINVPSPITALRYMTLLIALAAAMFYGVADYSGSRGSRLASSAAITFVGQAAALVIISAYLLVFRSSPPPLESWMWTTGGGFGGAIALVAF